MEKSTHLSRPPKAVRRTLASFVALIVALTAGVAAAPSAGAYQPVGTPAPCFVTWGAKGTVPKYISCTPSTYYSAGKKVTTFRVYSKTANIVGINTYGPTLRDFGFVVCRRDWGSQCRSSGSANA